MTPDSPATRNQSGAPGGEGMVAVDLGGTQMRVAVYGPDRAPAYKSIMPTPPDDPTALVSAIHSAVAAAGVPVAGAVVGVPGIVDFEEGRPLALPNLPRWEPTLSCGWLANEPGLSVLLANDADLAALGEHRFGAGRGALDMVYMTISTGVGAGVILGGRLLQGRRSLAEAGHMVIAHEDGLTVEDLGSGTALSRNTGIPGADAVRLALACGQNALRDFNAVADAFAAGVANMVMCFMPERVVIGGGVSRAGDLLLDRVRKYLERSPAGRFITPNNVVIAEGGEDVGLLGAYALWQDCTAPATVDTRSSPVSPLDTHPQ